MNAKRNQSGGSGAGAVQEVSANIFVYNPCEVCAMRIRLLAIGLLFLAATTSQAQQGGFDGVTKWQDSLNMLDVPSLKSLYSTSPPARFMKPDRTAAADISPETDFWQKALSSGAHDFDATMIGEQDQQGLHVVSLEVSMKMQTPNGPRTRYVTEQQAWQSQGNGWRIVVATHSDVLKMRPALKPNPNLYEKDADAKADIKAAETKAAKDHQRVILVFGGNWCYDCHVLDQAFHQADVAPVLDKNFQVVHVDIGDDGKKNTDVAVQYKVPLDKGVPALAILDAQGQLLYSQKNGEWESARSMDPDDVIAFLNKWKP